MAFLSHTLAYPTTIVHCLFEFTNSIAVNVPVGFVAGAITTVSLIEACAIAVPFFLPLQDFDIIFEASNAAVEWIVWVAFTVAWPFKLLASAIAYKFTLYSFTGCLLTVDCCARWASCLVAGAVRPDAFVVTLPLGVRTYSGTSLLANVLPDNGSIYLNSTHKILLLRVP